MLNPKYLYLLWEIYFFEYCHIVVSLAAYHDVLLQADLDLIATSRTVDITKAEIYAHTEIEVTQLEASDAIFEAQTAGMTEERKAQYIKQLREMKTPYLQGNLTLSPTLHLSKETAIAKLLYVTLLMWVYSGCSHP